LLENFNYICPNSIQEVFSVLDRYRTGQAYLLAGGTDLIPGLRSKEIHADCLIDLSKLGLDYIKCCENKIIIGALTTFRKLARDPVISTEIPVLSDAVNQIGSIQIRSLATIGGNVCNAAPSADSAAPLICLNAKLRLVSPDHERLVPVEDFFVGPGKTVLQKQELLIEIIIPIISNRKASFKKIGRRKAVCLPLANCAVSLSLDNSGYIEDARIALGALAPTPMRVIEAEKLLVGKKPSDELFGLAGKTAMFEIKPTTSYRASAEYKRLLAEVVVRRTLEDTLKKF
jgi:CO/xanthine dehydrogenase FAD-binding subunit